MVIFLLSLLVAALFLAAVRSDVAAGSTGDLVAASTVPTSSQPLVVRFIERSRRFRTNGAIATLILAAAGSYLYATETGTGGRAIEIDLVYLAAIGASGALAGSVLAEAFRFGRPRGPRVASLEVRDPQAYDDPVVARREQALLLTTAVAAAVGMLGDGSIPQTAVLMAMIVLLAALRRWGTRRIALRGRPALDTDLTAADDLVRRMAVSAGVGRPVTVLMALVGSLLWGSVSQAHGFHDGPVAASVSGAGVVVATASWIVAAVWWFQNRSYGLVRPDGRAITRFSHLRLVIAAVLTLVSVNIILLIGVSLVRSVGR